MTTIDFAEVLLEVVGTSASDLHLTPGVPPMVREQGQLRPLDYPKLNPTDTREIVYSILTGEQQKRLDNDLQVDIAYSLPGHGRFRVSGFFQRGAIGAA